VTRLPGSGTVPRAFALAVLVIVTVFLMVWVAGDRSGLTLALVTEALVLALAIRSLFVGVYLDGEAVLVRGWFRNYRYRPGELQKVVPVPYWKFLDAKDPILALLKFTPTSGWVREIGATVAWKDGAAAQARRIGDHLGVSE
jgi:hypothetical protein